MRVCIVVLMVMVFECTERTVWVNRVGEPCGRTVWANRMGEPYGRIAFAPPRQSPGRMQFAPTVKPFWRLS